MIFKIRGVLFSVVFVLLLSVVTSAAPTAIERVQTADEQYSTEDSFKQSNKDEEAFLDAVYFNGSGTQEDPYVLSSKSSFNMAATLIKSNAAYSKAYYVISQNIDFANTPVSPWGTSSQPFKGHLDGNGYKLYNIGFSDVSNYGIIAYMSCGSVKNIGAEYAPFTERASLTSITTFGGVVANATSDESDSDILIENCYALGNVCAETAKSVCFGGLLGRVKASKANVSVKNCAAVFDFDIVSQKDSYVAGFAADLNALSSYNYVFENCVSYGTLSVESKYIMAYCGGFCADADKEQSGWTDWVGELLSEESNFVNCVSVADVSAIAPSKAYAGKFLAKKGEYVKLSNNNAVASQSLVTGTNISNSVASTDKENLESSEYLAENFAFDFSSKWYLPPETKQLYPRVLLKAKGAPTSLEKYSIRLDEKSGIRFYSEIENDKKGYVTEYGFIAARKDSLADNDQLTFDYDGKYVYGAAYIKADNTDIFFDRNDDITTFTGVLTGIPKIHYDKYIVLRPYLKYEIDGKTEILYGKSVSASVNAVAEALKKNEEAYSKLSPEDKLKLEDFLPV